jgi:hypothetical protein
VRAGRFPVRRKVVEMARQVHTSIEASLLRQLRDEVHRRLAPYRHIALLAAVIVALLVRPLVGHNEACLILISLGDVAVLTLNLWAALCTDLRMINRWTRRFMLLAKMS